MRLHLRHLITLLIALALPLTGCLGLLDDGEPLDDAGDEPGDDVDPGTGDDDAGDGNETVNRAPTASLDVNLSEGDAPLAVAFTLDGSDPDGDNLTWRFDPGDGSNATTGDALPAVVNHTYADAGNHTAWLNVTDGNLTAATNLTVTVNASAPEVPEPVVIEGSALVGHPVHSGYCAGNGVDGATHAIDPASSGWTYAAEPADHVAIYWYTDDSYLEAGEASGKVPKGATRAEVCMTEGSALEEYTLTLWHPDHPDA